MAVILIIAELTGRAQFSQSFDHPKSFLSFIVGWFGFLLFMMVRVRGTMVSRIYYSDKLDKFVLFRPTGLVGFEPEHFGVNDFVLRTDKRAFEMENKVKRIITWYHGNVFINKRLRQIDFRQFSTDQVAEKLVGKANIQRLKNNF